MRRIAEMIQDDQVQYIEHAITAQEMLNNLRDVYEAYAGIESGPLQEHLDVILGYANDLRRGKDGLTDYKLLQLTLKSLPSEFTSLIQSISLSGHTSLGGFCSINANLARHDHPEISIFTPRPRANLAPLDLSPCSESNSGAFPTPFTPCVSLIHTIYYTHPHCAPPSHHICAVSPSILLPHAPRTFKREPMCSVPFLARSSDPLMLVFLSLPSPSLYHQHPPSTLQQSDPCNRKIHHTIAFTVVSYLSLA
ncbi:hypothetical protein B0H13DRAFT_2300896 [Mycena leptocephala]|nr:hypothetical protein B0H13DRAFT_2300896 [Mycena leptocephala]